MASPVPSEEAVKAVLRRLRGNRQVEYLCRAFLQFGADSMSEADLAKLTAAVSDPRRAETSTRGAKP